MLTCCTQSTKWVEKRGTNISSNMYVNMVVNIGVNSCIIKGINLFCKVAKMFINMALNMSFNNGC